MKISKNIQEYIENHLVYVATADARGIPNVVPKGSVAVLDDEYIVFADLYCHQTRKNIGVNPWVAVAVVNPAGYTGYQLKGKAVIVEHGRAYDALSARVQGAAQLGHPNARYAVKIKVSKVIDIGYGESGDKDVEGAL